MPRVLLEAGALGLPLITTDMPGCRDVVRHGIEGLLVPTKNSKALAEAILNLTSDSQLRKEFGLNAKKRVYEYFSLSKVTNEYAGLYKKLINQNVT